MTIDISIVIPAYNEENHIAKLVKAIKQSVSQLQYEIILIDNGSTDKTKEIAYKYNVQVFSIPKNTVSFARNMGVKKANSQIIAFLDADIRITKSWGDEIKKKIHHIMNGNVVTGSRCVIPEKPSCIEKNWFGPLSKKNVSYINSGNLIMSKNIFYQVGEFDELLETGEDYEFSMRATKKGIAIVNNSKFEAIHDDYPKNIVNFCKREIWHGKGDFQGFKSFFRSKVSIISVSFGILNLSIIASVLAASYFLSLALVLFVFLLCIMMSLNIFYKSGFRIVINNIPLCYFYLISRLTSLVVVLYDRFNRILKR